MLLNISLWNGLSHLKGKTGWLDNLLPLEMEESIVLKEYKRTRQHINFTAEDFNLITENTYNRFEKTE